MKEYIKKFPNATKANNYSIVDIPFTTSIATTPIQNLVCNQENKKISIDGQGNASIVDSKPIVIYHTRAKVADEDSYVEIQFEEGMTWNDFINSPYNDESKMSGTEIGRFSIDSEGYVLSPVYGWGPSQYTTKHKGTDKIISNIEYEVQGPGNYIYYDELPIL